MTLLTLIQRRLDQIAMYRIVTIALLFLVVCSLVFATVDILPYSPFELLASLIIFVSVAIGVNVLFAWMLQIPANHESALITGLILFFLVVPPFEAGMYFWLAFAAAVGITSKYVLTWGKQHIFNAVAVGAVVISATGIYEASWWIATPVLFIPLVVAGVAVVAKIRKWTPVVWFIVVAGIVFLFEEWRFGNDLLSGVETFLFSWPALFLAFFMLTEPFTLPGTKRLQAVYGALVGFLSSTAVFIPYFSMTPEFALVIGNIVLYPFTLRQKVYLTLQSATKLAHNTYEYVFTKPAGLTFTAGQYLEWMLPHKNPDSRGLRRYFTIASAPEESVVRLAVRTADQAGSTYKAALQQLKPGESMIVSQRAGDFILPADPAQKVAMVAGGIGVTPFSSHLAHMQATNRNTDTVLFYCNNTAADIAYQETFDEYAQSSSIRVVHVLSQERMEGAERGYLTKEIIARQTPDYLERAWYLSGPPGMVTAYSKLLRELKVPTKNIKKDFFPGLA